MTNEQIIENAKLIAEFLVNDTDEYGNDLFVPKQMKVIIENGKPVVQGIFEFKECLFHSSWDWLMPVVEKIEGSVFPIGESKEFGDGIHIDVIIDGNWCRIVDEDRNGYYDKSESSETKIEATYKAVVEFIKWYNTEGK